MIKFHPSNVCKLYVVTVWNRSKATTYNLCISHVQNCILDIRDKCTKNVIHKCLIRFSFTNVRRWPSRDSYLYIFVGWDLRNLCIYFVYLLYVNASFWFSMTDTRIYFYLVSSITGLNISIANKHHQHTLQYLISIHCVTYFVITECYMLFS